MRMGRPRTRRKDLPPGLHQDKWGTFYYRGTKADDRRYVVIGKVDRETAVRAWVKLTTRLHDDAEAGTVAEIIDRYLREELGELADATKNGYAFHCGKLRERWGSHKYAVTSDDAARGDYLRALDVSTYLRDARKARKGYNSALAAIGVLSVIFSFAREWGLSEYNPCKGVRRKRPERKTKIPSFEQIQGAAERAPLRLRLMIEWAWRTGMRQTDIRNLMVQQVSGDRLPLQQSKTGVEQDWEITPELRAILNQAAKLPGRNRSMFVFPTRSGKPLSPTGFQSDWQPLKAGFQFRAIRKWAINQKIAAGENATDFAGHSDPKTTRQHYDQTPKKVTPLR